MVVTFQELKCPSGEQEMQAQTNPETNIEGTGKTLLCVASGEGVNDIGKLPVQWYTSKSSELSLSLCITKKRISLIQNTII